MAAVGSTFNVVSYDAVWAEHRIHHLPNAEQIRYVLRHGRGFALCLQQQNEETEKNIFCQIKSFKCVTT